MCEYSKLVILERSTNVLLPRWPSKCSSAKRTPRACKIVTIVKSPPRMLSNLAFRSFASQRRAAAVFLCEPNACLISFHTSPERKKKNAARKCIRMRFTAVTAFRCFNQWSRSRVHNSRILAECTLVPNVTLYMHA